MNTKTFQIALQLLLIAGMFIAIAILWNKLPSSVPTQWKLNGTAGHYLPKAYGIFILPVLAIVVAVLMQALSFIDPKVAKRKLTTSIDEQTKAYITFGFIIVTVITSLFFIQLSDCLGWFRFGFPLYPVIITLAFAALGNFFGKLQPNYYVGIRTPWVLENDIVWAKTHRMAGYLWVSTSFIMLALFFVLDSAMYTSVFWGYLAVIGFVPVIYSYVLSRKLHEHIPIV